MAGKTQTIKQRALYLYLPSEELTGEWKDAAKKEGLSISKWIQHHVSHSREERESNTSRTSLIEENNRLRENNTGLQKQLGRQELAV